MLMVKVSTSCSSVVSFLLVIFKITRVASLSFPSNSSSANDKNWSTAVQKGTTIFRQLQSGCFPEKASPPTTADLVADNWNFVGWPTLQDDTLDLFSPALIRALRWTTEKDYYTIDAYRGDRGTTYSTEYNGFYSPRNGLVGAYDTHKIENEPFFWSDVAFALWTSIISKSRGDVKDIRYIGRAWICNEFTLSIIHSALQRARKKPAAVFGPRDEAFLALLGTANGAGGAYLLMQHKEVLGLKTFSRIVAGVDHGDNPFLVFEIVDIPTPRLMDPRGGSGACKSSA